MHPYKLVACSFHDELEALATLRQDCQIVYHDDQGNQPTVNSKIIDIYAADRADYIKLQNNIIIRLDHLISVNEKPIQFARSSFSCG